MKQKHLPQTRCTACDGRIVIGREVVKQDKVFHQNCFESIAEALRWIGYPEDANIDYCDNGSAYVGLTQILPPKK